MALRLPRRPPAGRYGGRLHFDFLGLGLFTGFIAPMLLALEQAQRFDPATLPLAAALAALAGGCLLLLVRQERRARMPLLPVKLLRQPASGAATPWRPASAHLVSLITFLPIYLQVVRGASPGQAGVLLLPLTMLIAIGSLCTGRLISRTGRGAIFPLRHAHGGDVRGRAGAPGAAAGARQLPFLFAGRAVLGHRDAGGAVTTVQFLRGRKQLGAGAASVQFSAPSGRRSARRWWGRCCSPR